MEEEAQALAHATRITETMQTEGWSLIRRILEEQVIGMEKIENIASLKELQAKQAAVRVIKNFLIDLDAIKNAKEGYRHQAVQKVRDPIFKLIK